jgi:primosomal replication protein N
MRTHSFAVADARNDQYETTIGTAAMIRIYNGTPPANVRTALSGNTVIAQGNLPSDWLVASASGVKVKAGTWVVTGQAGAGTGTAGTFYRIFDGAGTNAHEQGTFGAGFSLTTSSLTVANGNVLNFASTAGVAVGQKVTGTGVTVESFVLAFTGTTVVLDKTSSAGVASPAAITFGYDMTAENNSIATGQSLTVSTFSFTYGNL